ncbi:unnamed protein product [Candida verbasci]|uniref:CNH domain-containing protein n=1 Tax=Candida verbasci TaxID=1227364 RepID=A0A9W4X8T9_9ASCO|nr:unnamed protein product [Candida verbasci]
MNIDLIEPNNRIRIPSNIYFSNQSNHRISTILQIEKNLFLGLNNGDLLIYQILKIPIKESDKPVQSSGRSFRSLKSFTDIKVLFHENNQYNLINTFKNITKNQTPINSIKILPISSNVQKLIMLITTVEVIRIFEIVGNHINQIYSIEDSYLKISDYLYFEDNELRKLLIISSKKKLIIYQILNKSRNLFQFNKIKEIVVKDKIRNINGYNKDSIIVSTISDYFLVNIHTFNLSSLTGTGSSEKNLTSATSSSFSYFNLSSSGPQTWTIPIDVNNILLIKDTTIINLSKDNQELKPLSIKLSAIPIDIKFIYPIYLFIIYPKKFEIIDLKNGDLIQKFNHQINSSYVPINLFNDIISLGSGTYVLQFKIKSFESQIDQFLKISGKSSTSSSSTNLTNKNPANDLRYMGIEKAILLLSSLEATNSIYVNEKDKLMKLRELYTLKAILLFESYSKYHESLVDIASEWLISFQDILNLFPNFLNGEIQVFPNENEESSTNGTKSVNIIKKIKPHDLESSSIPPESEYDTDYKHQQITTINKNQNVRRFLKAVNNLIIYLTDQRRILSTFMDKSIIQWKDVEIKPREIYPSLNQLDDVATIIDTTLFLCYFYCKPMLLGPLLRLPNNHCDSKIVNECLLKNIHNHREQRNFKQPNYIKELLDFYYTRNLHKDALEMLYKLSHEENESLHSNEEDNQMDNYLKGPELTIKYLNKLNNDYLLLIFEFSIWVIDQNQSNAKLIFMNDSYECESYDNSKILQFFINKGFDNSAIEYLEWLLFQSDQSETIVTNYTKFETKLALLYLKQLKSEFKQDIYDKLYNLLKSNQSFDPWPILKELPTTDDKFLRLTCFAYKKLEEHEKSIDVLFNQLNDLESAMEYCLDIYNRPNGNKIGSDLFFKLLEDLLMGDREENEDMISRLLNLHGNKIPILKLLTVLPNSFKLNQLNKFLNSKISENERIINHKSKKNQLYKIGNHNLEKKVMILQNENFKINSSKQLCPICNKKLGYGIFTTTSDGNVIHYGCLQKK